MPAPQLLPLITWLEEGFRRRTWHGPNLMGSIRGLDTGTAEWRPGPGRHNIWELIVHCAYWKYTVTRRLTGTKRGSFPTKAPTSFSAMAGRLPISGATWPCSGSVTRTCSRRFGS